MKTELKGMKYVFLFVFFIHLNVGAQFFIPVAYWSGCKLPITYTRTDGTVTPFASGTLTNTVMSGTNIILAAAVTSGTYTSAPSNTFCGLISSWKDFSWIMGLHSLEKLPSAELQKTPTAQE